MNIQYHTFWFPNDKKELRIYCCKLLSKFGVKIYKKEKNNVGLSETCMTLMHVYVRVLKNVKTSSDQ